MSKSPDDNFNDFTFASTNTAVTCGYYRGIALISSAVFFFSATASKIIAVFVNTETIGFVEAGKQWTKRRARSATRVAAPGSANDVLEVTAANKNQALSLARVICGR